NCSAYKTLPTMEEKLKGQMEIAEKIRAVDKDDVARLVVEKHFLKDTKGNLRKFSIQQFRCSKCNEKYRRPPLVGKCTKCNGNLIFTVAEGSVIKYLEPSISLAEKYTLPPYLKQSLDLLRRRIESVFGKEKERQEGLKRWFG
ncbi:MAG: DNA polymerase II large subunit, partial [Candidatus Woesearchaeota archaeon]|nr:DNA polymerase II large subunit [Candidatus Woesearchaeota archaeon]